MSRIPCSDLAFMMDKTFRIKYFSLHFKAVPVWSIKCHGTGICFINQLPTHLWTVVRLNFQLEEIQ